VVGISVLRASCPVVVCIVVFVVWSRKRRCSDVSLRILSYLAMLDSLKTITLSPTDEARPNCKRCERGGFECDGYHTEIKFIDEGELSLLLGRWRLLKLIGLHRREADTNLTISAEQSVENSSSKSGA
jgi:hypothetical protein